MDNNILTNKEIDMFERELGVYRKLYGCTSDIPRYAPYSSRRNMLEAIEEVVSTYNTIALLRQATGGYYNE